VDALGVRVFDIGVSHGGDVHSAPLKRSSEMAYGCGDGGVEGYGGGISSMLAARIALAWRAQAAC